MGVELAIGAAPDSVVGAVADNLVSIITNNRDPLAGWYTSIGFLGIIYVFEALGRVNRTDVMLDMLLRTEYPSLGYEATNKYEPATALWESFDGDTMHQWIDESSRDHVQR